MAKAQLEIPTEVLEKAAQQTIQSQAKEIASLKAKLARREQKIKEMEAVDRQGEDAVKCIQHLLDEIQYVEPFYSQLRNRFNDYSY